MNKPVRTSIYFRNAEEKLKFEKFAELMGFPLTSYMKYLVRKEMRKNNFDIRNEDLMTKL